MAPRWGDDLTMKFVLLYEGEPDLWDTSSANYRNKNARIAALERLVTAMKMDNFTIKDCKTKIKNIRSHYWQEVSKITHNVESGADQAYKPTVVWFSIVDGFLRRFSTQTNKNNSKRKRAILELEDSIQFEDDSHAEPILVEDDEFQGDDISIQNNEVPQLQEDEVIPSKNSTETQNQGSTSRNFHPKLWKSSNGEATPVPSYVVEALSKLENKLEKAATKRETEFDVWCKSVAIQLNNMELPRALDLQLQIQTFISRERITHESRSSFKLSL